MRHFDILSEDWHISDHRPIKLQLEIETGIDIGGLIKRANDLNCSNNESVIEVQQFKGTYDVTAIGKELLESKEDFERSINMTIEDNNIQGAIDIFDEHIKKVHRNNKIRKNKQVTTSPVDFTPVNKAFDEFLKSLSDSKSSENETQLLLDQYILERKRVTKEALVMDNNKWTDVLRNNDAKAFWKLVDWKGSMKRKKTLNSPTMEQFEVFFEDLYKCSNQRELYDIMEISTDTEVPGLDQPINEDEIKTAFKDMKKPGFDYDLSILSILITYFSVWLVNIMSAILS